MVPQHKMKYIMPYGQSNKGVGLYYLHTCNEEQIIQIGITISGAVTHTWPEVIWGVGLHIAMQSCCFMLDLSLSSNF